MHCPVCNHSDTRVVDSRVTSDKTGIRRRRECAKCSFRFSTFEEPELLDLIIVKRDGRRQPYTREKLAEGIRQALGKRPYTQDLFSKLLHNIERDIQKAKKQELTSRAIGEIVMKHLKRFDEIGYIRFASVYRSFKDAASFQRELRAMLHAGKRTRR